jgi:GTP-binding protein
VLLAVVTIVGAPNVGKSTLFNRLLRRRQAIVGPEPGVTRDRLYGVVRQASMPFLLVDTGGLTPHVREPLAREVERQAELALQQSAIVLFVVDARAGLTGLDLDLAARLRRRGAPLILVANKVDAVQHEAAAHALYELGLGEPVPVSAEHGLGLERLLERIESALAGAPAAPAADPDSAECVGLAIVGRPNVGKSSLVNRMLGEERMLVSEQPGTTRDAVDTLLSVGERRYRLIDTAGLRRPGRPSAPTERYSALRARENIERCDVALLVVDGSVALTAQDTHIAGYIHDAHRPMVVAVNKWDLVENREGAAKAWEEEVRSRLRFAKHVPLVLTSARTGQRVSKILERVDEAHRSAGIRVSTQRLNRWLHEQPGGESGAQPPRGQLRLFYATQTGVHPPSFVVFCNDPSRAHFSVRRRLENSLRERFGFGGASIRLRFRGRRPSRARRA